jgi:hypothetical protein
MHWTDSFVGRTYIPEEYDCVHLVVEVQKEIYGKAIEIPVEREANVIKLCRQIDQHLETFYEQVDVPEDGDMVLMKCKGRLNHTGVYVLIDGTPYVLHNLRSIMSVAMHRLRDLEKYAVIVDSYYRVKDRETANLAKNKINTESNDSDTNDQHSSLFTTSSICAG